MWFSEFYFFELDRKPGRGSPQGKICAGVYDLSAISKALS
jgi:hypothetical protein